MTSYILTISNFAISPTRWVNSHIALHSPQAFTTHQYVHGSDRMLPAITMTSDQLFFFAYAQVMMCF